MPKASSRPSKPVASAKRGEERGVRQEADGPQRPMPPAETAQYIAEFTAELAYLARKANLDVLAYMLEMARLEAMQTARTK